MKQHNQQLELRFEKAVQFLVQHMPIGEERRKPLLMHALRVGFYLYSKGYSEAVVIAGLLHDVVEWTDGSVEEIHELFGEKVVDIVMVNTQNRDIEDKTEQWKDMVDRCVELGEDAVVVKAADTLDSLRYYIAAENELEVERSRSIGRYILASASTDMKGFVTEELRSSIYTL